MILKCKMCGGDLEIAGNRGIGVCQYCGSSQTLPRILDEKRVVLYDRANHFRKIGDFDKAILIYEKILEEDLTDAEAYWALVLCRYGVDYVVDSETQTRIPTCNRAQFGSIFSDEDYKTALKYADEDQKKVIEAEAKRIDEIQRNILSISQKEAPFDIFICYKETDAYGNRSRDSVLAQEIYYELEEAGFRVFFSRITLEDKPGTAYEPYIFAALNSARIMIVVGTKAEHINSVWVKNEWSRYLALIKKGDKKVLIPAYRDMDPYDLPEEMSYLQAQNMERLGFMQDLIHGVRKILNVEEQKKTMIQEPMSREEEALSEKGEEVLPVNVEGLLDRAYLFLEDREWDKAYKLLEDVLNHEPRNVKAYIGKIMWELRISELSELSKSMRPLETAGSYNKVLRFADENTKKKFIEINSEIIKRIEEERAKVKYDEALKVAESKKTEDLYKAAAMFEKIKEYRDSAEKEKICREKAKAIEARHETKLKMVGIGILILSLLALIFEIMQIRNDSQQKQKEAEKRTEENKKYVEENNLAWEQFDNTVWYNVREKDGEEIERITLEIHMQESRIEIYNAETAKRETYPCDVSLELNVEDGSVQYVNVASEKCDKYAIGGFNIIYDDQNQICGLQNRGIQYEFLGRYQE